MRMAALKLRKNIGEVFYRLSGLFAWTFLSGGLESLSGCGLARRSPGRFGCRFRRNLGYGRCRLLVAGRGCFGGGLGLGNVIGAHDVYTSIVPCIARRDPPLPTLTLRCEQLLRELRHLRIHAVRSKMRRAALVIDHV